MSKLMRVMFVAVVLIASALGQSTDGLVLSYNLENSTGVVISDDSPMGNNGTIQGEAYLDYDPVTGASVNFYGPSGQMVVPFSSSLEPRVGTLGIAVKVAAYQNASFISHWTDMMVNNGTSGNFAVYDLHMDDQGRFIGCIADDGKVTRFRCVSTPPKRVQTNTWQRVTLRWDGSLVALFVDGKLADARSYSAIPGVGLSYHGMFPLYVAKKVMWGRAQDGLTFPVYADFIGEVADVQLYSRALTDSEIARSFGVLRQVNSKR